MPFVNRAIVHEAAKYVYGRHNPFVDENTRCSSCATLDGVSPALFLCYYCAREAWAQGVQEGAYVVGGLPKYSE